MQQFWGMIRALQMIILSGMVNIKIPVHLHIFLQTCVVLANMDIMDGEGYYEDHLTFKETKSIGVKWEFFGIENSNFILNSGSYFVIIVGIWLYDFAFFAINKLCVAFRKLPLARRVGSFVYRDNYCSSSWESMLKLFLECYFDVVICTLINVTAFIRSTDIDDFKEFFIGVENVICSIITILHVFFIIVYPVFSFLLIRENQGKFDRMEGMIAILMEGVNPHSYHASMYLFYFLVRRLLTGIVLVIFVDFQYSQCMFLLVLSFANYCYLFTV